MEPPTFGFQQAVDSVEGLDGLPNHQKAQSLAQVVVSAHKSNATGGARVLLQGVFCQSLLKSLQPNRSDVGPVRTDHGSGQQQHSLNPATQPGDNNTFSHRSNPTAPESSSTQAGAGQATTTLAQAWASAAHALELIYTWEDEEVVMSVIQFWSKTSSLFCGSWLQDGSPAPSTDTPCTSATPLQANCPAQPEAARDSSNLSTASAVADAVLQHPKITPEVQYLSWLWGLGPAAVAAVIQQMHQFWQLTGINHMLQQQHTHHHIKSSTHHLTSLLLLFLDLQPSKSHDSSSSSDSSRSCITCPQPAVQQLLQLLHGSYGSSTSSVAATLTAGEGLSAACCLLQAAAVLQVTQPDGQHTPAAAAAVAVGDEAAGSNEAHDGGSTDAAHQPPPPPAAAAAAAQPSETGSSFNTCCALLWPDLIRPAGRWLEDCYGWCTFGEAAEVSPAAAAAAAEAAQHAASSFATSNSSSAATVSRPVHVESLYDCFMMALLQQMLQGPCSSSSTNPDFNSNTPAHPATAGGSATATGSTAGSTLGGSLNSSDWEDWIESAAATALAALVSTYDRLDVLARGLHILTQQQLMVDQNQAATTAAAAAVAADETAGDGPGGSGFPPSSSQPAKAVAAAARKADKAAMGRALWLLERVFLWRQQLQQQGAATALAVEVSSSSGSAVAGGVCQLLLALSELLRPAANCSVEWRCGALSVMLTAVEDFVQQPAGDAGLELQLWCDRSVEGLLYCANHDPSIQARRAAVQLLQHVVLPSSSPTASALTRCLASKLCDKDRGVAAAALQMFVQVEPRMLCGCLTAAQWSSAVQAGLGLLCGAAGREGGGGPSTQGAQAAGTRGRGSRGGRGLSQQQWEQGDTAASSDTRELFVGLLRRVLGDSSELQPQQQLVFDGQWLMTHGGQVVGVQGCRQVLLQLVMEPCLADNWQALAGLLVQ